MTEQIEWIGIRLLRSLRQRIKGNATFRQMMNDFCSLLRIRPFCPKFWCGRKQSANRLRCVIRITDHAQLPTGRIKFIDEIGRNFDLTTVKIKLTMLFTRWLYDDRPYSR